jgi:eukaryotic-like serine/threonine-protein kinase
VNVAALSPGRRVGRYRLQRLLGEGASGVVFAAVDDRDGRVALKVLRPELAGDAALRARFTREARLAHAIDSTHVAPIIELAEARGLTYLVQPLYEGGSLAARLRTHGALHPNETADLSAQLARGLGALHERGIVHRDLKPSNVLFTAEGTAAITDFGLARAADSTRLTLEGQLLGTPHYVAPELIEGLEATPASDLYALGCLLYECAVGEPPFAGRRATEVGFAHLTEPAPDPRERRPELPPDFALALLTALEKNPSARPTTPTAFARMLHLACSAPRA